VGVATLDKLSAVENLIALLRDGERGFAELAEHIHAADCRDFMKQESNVRAVFATELERVVYTATGMHLHPDGTRLASVHRSWLDLKARFGADDVSLLRATEMCEGFAVRAYQEVLENSTTPDAVRAVVAQQFQHVQRSQGIVQELRTLIKARAE